jgi:superfamily II DNA or RNA helicase
MPELRPYQARTMDKLDQLSFVGVRAPLIVAPTGSGKTVIAGEIIKRAGDSRTLFLAPRRELIHQTCHKLDDVGVRYGVLLAGDRRTNLYSNVQVASRDTLISRMLRTRRLELPPFDRIIIDEAHVGLTERSQQLYALWPNAQIIGLTATPTRSDGKALGRVYDEIIEVATTRELTEQGYLVPGRYFSVSEPDMRGVRTTGGDFNLGDTERVMNREQLVGDIVEHWLTHAPNRRTVVFATQIAHSVALAQQFLVMGVTAEHVDANTPQSEREAIFERFSDGRTQVLTNCTLASIGFDLPALDCVVFARPTKSVGLYLQMLGRGLRPAPGKSDCLVLDHAGNVHRHGFATDDRYWTLHGKYAIDEKRTAEAAAAKASDDIVKLTCPQCKYVWEGGRSCPACGYYLAPKARAMMTRDGQLVEISKSGKVAEVLSENSRRNFYLELAGLAEMRGYKPGYAAMKYRERFNVWPPRNWSDHVGRYGGIDPSMATMRWVKSRTIAFHRAKKRDYHPDKDATLQWLEETA